MNARKCDRCGGFYEAYSVWNGCGDSQSLSGKPSCIVFARTDADNTKYCTAEYNDIPKTGKKTRDLCPMCMDELLAWWKSGKQGAENG